MSEVVCRDARDPIRHPPMIYLFVVRVVEKVLVARFETVCEAQDLKTVAITNGPDLQLVPVLPVAVAIVVIVVILLAFVVAARPLVKAHVAGNLVEGSIDAGSPGA